MHQATPLFDRGAKLGQRRRRVEAPHADQILLPGAPGLLDAETCGELRVVAELGMRVEWQMVGKQVEAALERERDAAPARTGDAQVLVAPEPAVMHQHRIGVRLRRRFEQREARTDAGDEPANLRTALQLQPVRAVIAEARRLEQRIEITVEFVACHVRCHRVADA